VTSHTGTTKVAGGREQHIDVGRPQYFDFTCIEPDTVSNAGSSTWRLRAKNIVFVLTELKAGDHLVRVGDADEHMLVMLNDTQSLDARAGDQTLAVTGRSIIIIPPGDSEITAKSDGRVLQLFPPSAADLADSCRNSSFYVSGAPHVAKSAPWPAPKVSKLHVYTALDQIPSSPNRMGRIYRNRHAMVNFLYARLGPRDPSSLSPHHHDDFEQLSYADSGEYVHHIRTPWTKDRRDWRQDEHIRLGSPSLIIIPPPTIHTSEAIGPGRNQLLDVFAGPRSDFSSKDGWVLNADDYPTAQAWDPQ
jgi:hypothetical protein